MFRESRDAGAILFKLGNSMTIHPEGVNEQYLQSSLVSPDQIETGVNSVFEEGFDGGSSDDISEGRGKKIGNFLRRQKTKICIGATALSVGATLALNPLEETTDQVIESLPYVATGIIGSEIAWMGGAAMMLSSVGSRIPLDPRKLKAKMPEIAEKANDSKLFKAGFAVNVAGALGDFVILSGGVVKTLPPHSWGVLGFTLLDLGVTLGVRKAMLSGISKHAGLKETEE